MLQQIDGKEVYVVQFDEMPELPIRGLTEEESLYNDLDAYLLSLARTTNGNKDGFYARALNDAIINGIVTVPGKYAIWLDSERSEHYEIYAVVE